MCLCYFDLHPTEVIAIVGSLLTFGTLVYMKLGNDMNMVTSSRQMAENTIFKQLELHNNLLNGIEINDKKGQESFKVLYNILKNNYSIIRGSSSVVLSSEDVEHKRIEDSFNQLYIDHGSLFGNYFKNLYLLIKYIDHADIKDFNQKFYIDLVKSQLSKYEILLFGYYFVWIQDQPIVENFLELAQKHSLLSALETDELINSVSSIKHIDISMGILL